MLMRHHWHRHEEALRIESAVRATLAEGAHTSDINPEGAISTGEFTDKVCGYLN
jgi:isocitrate/isopropylmalate dehydrogenase